jgi:futalosine hydrolase
MELRAYDGGLDAAVEQTGCGRRGRTLFLLTGVGIPHALETVLLVAAREKPQRILNIGIAGAYPNSGLQIGDVVMGRDEVYGDIGFELPEEPGFQPLQEAAFGAEYRAPLPLMQCPQFQNIAIERGCTVSQCTGTEATGLLRERLFDAAFETMEGAAVAQAGHALGIPVAEVRAISNRASRRNMQPDNIRVALTRLKAYFEKYRE